MDLYKTLKSKAIKSRIVWIILLIVLALGFAGAGRENYENKNKTLPDLNTQTGSELKKFDWYEVELNYLVDTYATDKKGNYYITALGTDNTFLGVYIPKNQIEEADRIVDETWAYINGTSSSLSSQTLKGRGPLNGMSDKEKQYFIEWFTDAGISEAELEGRVLYLKLDLTEGKSAGSEAVIFFLLAAAAAAIAVILLIRLFSGKYRKNVDAVIERNHLVPELVSEDLSQGLKMGKAVFGQKYALLYQATPVLIDYQDLVWVYKKTETTQHKIYGIIPAGKTVVRSVIFAQQDKTAPGTVVKKEEEGDQIVQHLMQYAPHAIYGYSQEREQMYKMNFDAMRQVVEGRKQDGQQL